MTKLNYELAEAAKRDIIHALIESRRHFGAIARTRYRKLIDQAIEDICEDPDRIGTYTRKELGSFWKTYHLAYSKHRAAYKNVSVKKPRHILVYTQIDSKTILIARVLHDAMELSQHIPQIRY